MQPELENLHRILGAVVGDICMALVLHRVTNGRAAIRGWLASVREAEKILARLSQ
jgi:hypothetical protein